MEGLGYIAPWVLASVCVGIVAGVVLGRGRSKRPDPDAIQRERQVALRVLADLLGTAERMSHDVESHNSQIRDTATHVGSLHATGEVEGVKQALLTQIGALLVANTHLQQDLVTSRYRMEEQAQELDEARREARTDALTSVANRKAFDEKLHLLLVAWEQESQPFVLLLVDLDYFKRINDAHGHQAGDRVLERVGVWLKQWVREGDFVSRYGGDEFAILLPHTDLGVGAELAETIRARTADRVSRVAVRREQVSVSFSIGAAAPAKDDTADSILRRADTALYKAKHCGRNQVRCQEAVAEPAVVPEVPAPTPAALNV